jgi:hypothetical protein
MGITSGPVSRKSGVALALSLLGLFFVPIAISVLAVWIGAVAIFDFDHDKMLVGRGMAVTGILLGVAGVITGIAGWAIGRGWSWLIFYMY